MFYSWYTVKTTIKSTKTNYASSKTQGTVGVGMYEIEQRDENNVAYVANDYEQLKEKER